MKEIFKSYKKVLFISLIILIIVLIIVFFVKKTYSYQSIYDVLPENSIIVGREVFTGEVNPNNIANAAINYYKEIKDENVKIYKYSGLDKGGNPIWGTYSDESNSYVEISLDEIKNVETILNKKYKISV